MKKVIVLFVSAFIVAASASAQDTSKNKQRKNKKGKQQDTTTNYRNNRLDSPNNKNIQNRDTTMINSPFENTRMNGNKNNPLDKTSPIDTFKR